MRISSPHPWKVTPKEAADIQKRLARYVVKKDSFKRLRYIAGADIALDDKKNIGIGGVIVYSFPDLKEIERRSASVKLGFPYIPGLLSFREAPVLLKVFRKIKNKPDLIFIDGQGVAHPRRFGLASHVGVLLDTPVIGCAKSRLLGSYKEPGIRKGSFSMLYDGEVIGMVLRTRDGVKPVFVSVGHKISLETAVRVVLKCSGRYRIPVPTREPHIFVESLKRGSA